ncbi:MAG: CPBP family intramembrane metalloprotease, partial [Ruminococcaceae bacterium]|nr:CPBP family intramembrane metalloprotease [Oscillospiraceae bacterium]
GVIMAEYERNGVAVGVIMSALTFSFIHFSFERMPVYFFNGVILALVLYATRSLLGAVIVHAANNVFALFFEVYIYRAAVRQGGGLVMFGFLTVCACLLFAVLFFGAAQKNYAEFAERNLPSDHAVKKKRDSFPYAVEPFASPAFIALAVISIIGAMIRKG